ncbi:MAG: hypothetical protein JJT78_01985, partial [Leptospira sp.]|nr:hypothetical protein [Leptospira sp.]
VTVSRNSRDFLSHLQNLNHLQESNFGINSYLVWNLVEGYHSRNREGYIPAICEYWGIACTGSDSYAQNISLDKYTTKLMLQPHINVAPGNIVSSEVYEARQSLDYPLFIKPRGEGSGLGVNESSILHSPKDWNLLLNTSDTLLDFKSPSSFNLDGSWIYEKYLSGAEYTVCMLQEELDSWISIPAKLSYPHVVYGEEIKRKDVMPETFDLNIPLGMKNELQELSQKIVRLLGAEGYARLDFRESEGVIYFLEINLTPGLSNIYSLFPKIIQEFMDWDYEEILGRIASISWKNFHNLKRYQYGRNQNSRFC